MSHSSELDLLVSKRVIEDIERGRGEAWINTSLRTRSAGLRELLARELTGGVFGERRLREFVASEGHPPEPPAGVGFRTTAALGTVWAASRESRSWTAAGHQLLRVVVERKPDVLTFVQQQIYAQASLILGELDDVEHALAVLPGVPLDVAASLHADLLNPTLTAGDTEAWLDRLSAPFTKAGLSSLSIESNRDTLFDGLSGHSGHQVDGPLVSVLMPCFRPDGGLFTSLKSILAQSYENFEVILVDDASGPEYLEFFDRAGQLDSRIRVLRMERNGGTYRARNAALQISSGCYITVQDADDWSHPARLSDQVQALETSSSIAGSWSDAIRATDDLLHQWIGYSPRRRNASSLMFRRSDLGRIGPFDLVRKSGDSEFAERLRRLIGPIVDTRTPLAITRLRPGTLSRSDFSYQWMASERLIYRSAYRSWHRTLSSGASIPGPANANGGRAFPAPAAMTRDLPYEAGPELFDMVIIVDASNKSAVNGAIALCTSRPAMRTGVIHVEDSTLGRSRRPEPVDAFSLAARNGLFEIVASANLVQARVTVVLNTGSLELCPSHGFLLEVERVFAAVRPPSGVFDTQDLLAFTDVSRALLGRRPTWACANTADQSTWAEYGWQLPLIEDLVEVTIPS